MLSSLKAIYIEICPTDKYCNSSMPYCATGSSSFCFQRKKDLRKIEDTDFVVYPQSTLLDKTIRHFSKF